MSSLLANCRINFLALSAVLFPTTNAGRGLVVWSTAVHRKISPMSWHRAFSSIVSRACFFFHPPRCALGSSPRIARSLNEVMEKVVVHFNADQFANWRPTHVHSILGR